jgi:hypothetical protein
VFPGGQRLLRIRGETRKTVLFTLAPWNNPH